MDEINAVLETAPHLALWPGVCQAVVVYSPTYSVTRCATCWTRGCVAAAGAMAPAGSSGINTRLIALHLHVLW